MTTLFLAANQGQVSGGEVMLLRTAEAARSLGVDVAVVAPESPGELVDSARRAGFEVVGVPGRNRAAYAAALRRWDRGRRGLLWCHGLVPAAATAGHRDRIVHLHQPPEGHVQLAAFRLAARSARELLVVSDDMHRAHPSARLLTNWTDEPGDDRPGERGSRPVIGFLGRLAPGKGLVVLAEAVRRLAVRLAVPPVLLLAGDGRFVPAHERGEVEAALVGLDGLLDRRGWMDRVAFFEQVDVLAFPSIEPEPFGLGAAEAMAERVPVVVSDSGALPEVVGPGHPWVVPTGEVEPLARALADALTRDGSAAVERAHRRWQDEYSPAAGRRRVQELLDGLGVLTTGAGPSR